jgi:hypothetical protein
MKFPEGKDAREKHLEKVINKWYEGLLSLYEYSATTVPVEDDALEADIPF